MKTVGAICVAILATLVAGCFDMTTKADIRRDGSALVDVEIAISMQLLGMAAAFAKDGTAKNPLEDCASAKDTAKLKPGIKVLKSAQGVRGDMMTCTITVEIEKPVEALANTDTFNSIKDAPPVVPKDFALERLGPRAYRLAGAFEPKRDAENPFDKSNPFAAMMVAAMANHYVTLSISALRIENTTGDLTDKGKTVTWKLPIIMLANAPSGFRQEVKADIIYDETWWETAKSWVGLN